MNILNSFSNEDIIINQDEKTITKLFFIEYVNHVANLIDKFIPDNEIVGVRSDNNALGLAMICAVIKTGRNVLPLQTFNDGPVNDYLIDNTNCKHFIGYGTEIDHSKIDVINNTEYRSDKKGGGIVVSSSGTTGLPKITLSNFINNSIEEIHSGKQMVTNRIGDNKYSAFYSPPMMLGCMVYFAMLSYGIKIYCTNGRPSNEFINKLLIDKKINILSFRPSMIDKFILSNEHLEGNVDVVVSSGAPLSKEHVDYCVNILGVKHILDFYATTESGIIAVRDATLESLFELFPDVNIKSYNKNGVVIQKNEVSGFWSEGIFKSTDLRFIDDIIELNSNKILPLGRKTKKIKVSGFSVPSELVKQTALQMYDIFDCKVLAESSNNSSSILKLEYTGNKIKRSEIVGFMSQKLPFYCIPKRIKYVPQELWGVTK